MSSPVAAPGINPNASQIPNPVANVGALANVAQTLKQNVDSLTGMRGSVTNRAVLFTDLVNLGLLSAQFLASPTAKTNFVQPTQVIDNVNVIGPGIFKSGGSIGVEWNAGQVGSLGAHLSIVSETLTISGFVTTVVAGDGISVTGTTTPRISAEWIAGPVTRVGPGLSLGAGILQPQWRAGTVVSVGSGLALSPTTGVLSATSTSSGMAPLVTGELDADGGPKLIADPDGQCVMVPL